MIALLLAILPLDDATCERCDLIELNHVHDDCGQHTFSQLIFWEWTGTKHDVIAWRLVKYTTQHPTRDWRRGGYYVRWLEGDKTREIRSPCYRESWTQYDVEMHERNELPKERRRELRE